MGKYSHKKFCLLARVLIVIGKAFLTQIVAMTFSKTLCLDVPNVCPTGVGITPLWTASSHHLQEKVPLFHYSLRSKTLISSWTSFFSLSHTTANPISFLQNRCRIHPTSASPSSGRGQDHLSSKLWLAYLQESRTQEECPTCIVNASHSRDYSLWSD